VLGRPDVDVIVRSGGPAELLSALDSLNLDIVLMNRPPATDALSAFVARRLAAEPVSLVGTPARIGADGAIAALLRAHPVILPTPESGVRIGFDALADRLGIRPQVAAEVDDMAMMRLLAAEDIGLAVLPPIVVRDELAAGRLVEAARLPDIAETFYAVTLERRFPNPLVRALLDAGAEA
jgi:LysR family transcriptional activator of nhaA